VVDNHATNNPAISDVKRGKNRIKTESLSLVPLQFISGPRKKTDNFSLFDNDDLIIVKKNCAKSTI